MFKFIFLKPVNIHIPLGKFHVSYMHLIGVFTCTFINHSVIKSIKGNREATLTLI